MYTNKAQQSLHFAMTKGKSFNICKLFSCLALLFAFAFLVSCSDDDNTGDGGDSLKGKLTVQLTAGETSTDYTKFSVSAVDMKSGQEYKSTADANGTAKFQLPVGTFNVTASDASDGASTMYGHAENVTVTEEDKTIEVKLSSTIDNLEKSFVLNELYFNGDTNGDYDMVYYESYMTITNVSDQPLYADGLSIAICGDYNNIEAADTDPMPQYLKRDSIVITQLYTIPGNGTTYKVEPGQSLVLAHSAINHKLGDDGKEDPSKNHSIDLSGANFEFYVPFEGGAMTTDNPEVPNMTIDYAMNQAFNWGYSGATPVLLVHLDAATKAKVVANKVNLAIPMGGGTMKMDHLVLPVSCIIDGVETGAKDSFFRKVLPDNVDRGSIQVETAYGFDGQFIQRKHATANGKETLADTNNSSEDFEILPHGQKSYPKK